MLETGQLADGRYRILRKLGEGAFGETYLGEEAALEVPVVLKAARQSSPEMAGRLRDEARALARLRHPGIAQIYSSGVLADGRPFLAMEYVEGETLEALIRRAGPLRADAALETLAAVASALTAVHEAGLVHRDLKPANIILSRSGPKLIDFGAFGELIREAGLSATAVGSIVGTPLYMSPEQVRGERQTAAADVYGLGAVLFETLYGRPPFEAGNLTDLIGRIVSEEPTAPEFPTVPGNVRSFVLRCLSKRPAERPTDGRAAHAEIAKLLRGLPAAAPSAAGGADERERTFADEVLEGSRSGQAVITWAERVDDDAWARRTIQAEPAPPRGLPRARIATLAATGALLLALAIALTLSLAGDQRVVTALLGFAVGSVLIGGGFALARRLRRWIRQRAGESEAEAGRLLFDIESRDALSQTLSIQVRELIKRCSELDQSILGVTILAMIREYEDSEASDQRQAALMNAADLLGKLKDSLSPWYVRHEKALAFGVSAVGVLSGLVSVAAGVQSLFGP